MCRGYGRGGRRPRGADDAKTVRPPTRMCIFYKFSHDFSGFTLPLPRIHTHTHAHTANAYFPAPKTPPYPIRPLWSTIYICVYCYGKRARRKAESRTALYVCTYIFVRHTFVVPIVFSLLSECFSRNSCTRVTLVVGVFLYCFLT